MWRARSFETFKRMLIILFLARLTPTKEKNVIEYHSVTFVVGVENPSPLCNNTKKVSNQLNSGLARNDNPSMTPMIEGRPLPLINTGRGSPNVGHDLLCNCSKKLLQLNLPDKKGLKFHTGSLFPF